MFKNKVLVKITGSIAAYKSAYLISKLVQNGYEVKTVATKSALKFIGEAALEGLTGQPVLSDSFEPGKMMSHIELVKWADIVIVVPATANTINKFAAGIGDNLVTALYLAHDFGKPYLIAPAMNVNMYNNPATQESIKKLRAAGVKILPTETGHLACGDEGEGKLLDPDKIFSALVHTLSSRNHEKKRILITSGGTTEFIDGVRSVTNFSTGRTGAALAETFFKLGHNVEILRAKSAKKPDAPIRETEFESYSDLRKLLNEKLRGNHYDAIIHLAAVSDYIPVKIEIDGELNELPLKQKAPSHSEYISIKLKRTEKLVDGIKKMSKNSAIKLVSFKLINGTSDGEQCALELLRRSSSDAVVLNNMQSRFGDEQKVFTVLTSSGKETVQTVKELGSYLNNLLWRCYDIVH